MPGRSCLLCFWGTLSASMKELRRMSLFYLLRDYISQRAFSCSCSCQQWSSPSFMRRWIEYHSLLVSQRSWCYFLGFRDAEGSQALFNEMILPCREQRKHGVCLNENHCHLLSILNWFHWWAGLDSLIWSLGFQVKIIRKMLVLLFSLNNHPF